MAGIGEMIQLAQYVGEGQARSNPLYTVAAGANAVQRGIAAGTPTLDQKLEKMLKIVELRDKLVEMKKKQVDLEINKNIAKSAGLMDYEDNDMNVIRQALFGNINSKDNKSPSDKLQKNKLSDMITKAENKRFELVPSGDTKSGFRYSIKEKDKEGAGAGGSGSGRADRNAVWNMARQMALIEERENLSEKEFLAKYATEWSNPSEDKIRKYIPEAQNWFEEGDPDKLFVEWRKTKKKKFGEANPLGDPLVRKYLDTVKP